MKRTIKLISMSMLPALVLAAGSVTAQSPTEPVKAMTQEKTTAGEQFQNVGEEDQLRHRVNENDPEQAKKVRAEKEKQTQEGTKSQHKYQYEEQSPGQHMNQSGGGMGGGMGGGGRR